MKFIKRTLLIILIISTVGLFFRGWFYRHLVTYKSDGIKTNYLATNIKLTDYIDANTDNQTDPDIKQIIKLGLSITSRKLNFTVDKNDTDPNKLIISKTAHCVGYASFFATTCNYLLEKYNLSDTWTAKPQAGQLNFLGTNIHIYFTEFFKDTKFFKDRNFIKDHDFVTIENKKTGEILAVDPTANDYLRIDFITYNK